MRRCSLPYYIVLAALAIMPAGLAAQELVSTLEGNTANLQLGRGLACAGSTALIGAPGRSAGGMANVGEVTVFNAATGTVSYVIPSPNSSGNNRFGSAIEIINDLNNDGLLDFVIGAPNTVTDGTAHAINGDGSAGLLRSFSGNGGPDLFGAAILAIGDIDGDSDEDIAVGAPHTSVSGSLDGEVFFLDAVNGMPLYTLTGGLGSDENLGAALDYLPDISNDGLPEIIVGAPQFNSGVGRVRIYSMGASSASQIAVLGPTAGVGGEFGASVSAIRDVNGDGSDDILVGEPGFDGIGNDSGRVTLFSGASAAAAPLTLCSITGFSGGDRFGSVVESLGLQGPIGQQVTAFAVGAPGVNSGTGATYIFTYDGSNCVILRTINGSVSGQRLGSQLTSSGPMVSCDLDGDEAFDLGVGTLSDLNGSDAGSAAFYQKLVIPTPTPTATPTPTSTPTPTATPTPASPTQSDFTFRISETGVLTARVQYDAEPSSRCSYTIFGRVKNGSRLDPVQVLATGKYTDSSVSEQTATFRLTNVPMAMWDGRHKPIINMMIRTTCAGTTFDSNVFARFMNCGVPGTSATVAEWIRVVKNGFAGAVASGARVKSSHALFVKRIKPHRRK